MSARPTIRTPETDTVGRGSGIATQGRRDDRTRHRHSREKSGHEPAPPGKTWRDGERKVRTRDESAEKKIRTRDKSAERKTRTRDKSAERKIRTRDKSAERKIRTRDKSAERKIRTRDKSAKAA